MILYVLVIYVTLCILPLMSCTIASQLNVALLTLTHVFVMAKSIVLCLMPIKYIVLYCIVFYLIAYMNQTYKISNEIKNAKGEMGESINFNLRLEC